MPSNCGAGEDSWKSLGQQGDQTSQSKGRSTLNIHWRTDAEALVFRSSEASRWLIGKVPDAGKDWGKKGKRATEDEMATWHHWCNEHELGQTPGDSEGQGGLVCCSPWGCKEPGTTGWLNNNNIILKISYPLKILVDVFTTKMVSYQIYSLYKVH